VQNIVWFDGSDSPTHVFYETGVYQVTTSNSCETISKFWSMEFVDCDNYVFVPNSFTPNGDGINDYWFPSFNNASSFEVAVFSRWGDLIFETKSEKPWVGNTNNGDYFCPDGVYAYSVKVKFNNGSAQELTGHIVLLR
jgi:gliding motility-associated-like protein